MGRYKHLWIYIIAFTWVGNTWAIDRQDCHNDQGSNYTESAHDAHGEVSDHSVMHGEVAELAESDCPCCDDCTEDCSAAGNVVVAVVAHSHAASPYPQKLRCTSLSDAYCLPPPERLLRPPIHT